MLDMYLAWNDLETALSYIEMYQQFEPYWIEDPLLPDDLELYNASCRADPATGGHWRVLL